MHDSSAFRGAFRDLIDGLEAWGQPFLLLGGWAVAAQGYVRATSDINMTLPLAPDKTGLLLERLVSSGIISRIQASEAFARRARVLLLVHEPSGIEIDISLAVIPFELEAIEQAEWATVEGHQIRIPRLEDLLVFKLVAGRPRDLDDVENLLLRNPRPLDLDQVDRILAEFCEVLEDSSRLTAWRAIKDKLGRIM
jgi:hypothetical protein